MLLAIDPGRDTGWAEFTALGGLLYCGVGDPRFDRPTSARPEKVVIERPQIYQASRNTKNADPNDLITLAIQVGEYKEFFGRDNTQLLLPSEWKGQVPKHIHNARVYAALKEHEQAIVDTAGKGCSMEKIHNMMDAIGLGLFALGRTRRGAA